MEYRTVLKEVEDEFTEKKSRFIGVVIPVTSWEDAEKGIESVKTRYRGAKHYAYACIIRENNIIRYSDDGEPQGSAGTPMLEVLKGGGMADVLVVAVRYFGGILLGVGGLVRAYTQSAKLALGAAECVTMQLCDELLITTDYNMYGKVSYILPKYDAKIIENDFGEAVKVRLIILSEETEAFVKEITDESSGTAICEMLEKRYDFIKK